ncbi:hypothetical protein BO71DRAFT_84087 [Aspergillus ellipticus CBS 707.79]|uniref:Uncharacterized protein n=1 Tax=Aspergillus ellipticus CBS 707.79 TaxID=1448320 RepID=A0A319DQH6_9EURO|nr:hypothetical protein BO71DRAFT_84087 [Aspergillus ellipticus CBS 707.79]
MYVVRYPHQVPPPARYLAAQGTMHTYMPRVVVHAPSVPDVRRLLPFFLFSLLPLPLPPSIPTYLPTFLPTYLHTCLHIYLHTYYLPTVLTHPPTVTRYIPPTTTDIGLQPASQPAYSPTQKDVQRYVRST